MQNPKLINVGSEDIPEISQDGIIHTLIMEMIIKAEDIVVPQLISYLMCA